VRKEIKVSAPLTLWERFDQIMVNWGCKTQSEKFREAMRIIVTNNANGVAHGTTI
jgi:metal-responsive CopG/Arc/MetJ family transcriptional regulator